MNQCYCFVGLNNVIVAVVVFYDIVQIYHNSGVLRKIVGIKVPFEVIRNNRG